MVARRKNQDDVEVLERGNVYFLYRPRVEEEEPEGVEDVQRLYMVLSPDHKNKYRLAVLGRKKLPDPSKSGGGRFWGFIESVSNRPEPIRNELQEHEYGTKTRGERHLPAARPLGEGVYCILRHGNHTHLVYALELPERPGEVQREFNIEDEASYVISIKNPEKGGPRGAGLSGGKAADYPKYLQEAFRGRRFGEADPPQFLDQEGAEFLLVSASDDLEEELGIELDTEHETESTAEIFKDLRLQKSEHPLEPLFEGKWE